jgi:transcriptional regulator with XRE-family HTH domain
MDIAEFGRFGQDARMENRIKEWRLKRGYSMADLGTRLGGVDPSTVNKLEKGQRKLTQEWLKRFSEALDCTPFELMGDQTTEVPVVGYVGAGAEVFPFDDHAQGHGFERIEAPFGVNPKEIVAVRIVGNSMYPIKEGWTLFYKKDHDGITTDCINKLCICRALNGAMYIKEVHKGSRKGLFTLISWNAPPIEDIELEWCAPVIDIRPR